MPDVQLIQNKIYEVRGVRVMLDVELAELYETSTSQLKRAVRRNIERFPDDFMFELTKEEANYLLNSGVFKFGTPHYNFSAYPPFAFTEQGVAMLSSVLKSETALKVNIAIMRAFVQMRQFLLQNKEVIQGIEELRRKMKELEESNEDTLSAINDLSEDTRKELDDIYLALAQMADKRKIAEKRNPIGFVKPNE